MKGYYEREEHHRTAITEGISRMSPEAKKLHAERISLSFADRVPRVYDRDLYELWVNSSVGYKKFRKLAVQHGFEDKDYVHTVRVFRKIASGEIVI